MAGKNPTLPPRVTWDSLPGKPTTFAPAAHTHSYNDLTDKPTIPTGGGRLEVLGDINVTETLLLSLAVGMKRKTFPLAGVKTTDNLVMIATGAPTTGCEAVNVYQAGAGQVSVGYYTPLLGIGATYTIPIRVYRIT